MNPYAAHLFAQAVAQSYASLTVDDAPAGPTLFCQVQDDLEAYRYGSLSVIRSYGDWLTIRHAKTHMDEAINRSLWTEAQ